VQGDGGGAPQTIIYHHTTVYKSVNNESEGVCKDTDGPGCLIPCHGPQHQTTPSRLVLLTGHHRSMERETDVIAQRLLRMRLDRLRNRRYD